MAAWTDFSAGMRTTTPILLGVIPFALIAGIAAVNAGMAPMQAISMSVIVVAGAAQLAAINLIDRTAPIAVIVLTALIINLRLLMYSASIAPYFHHVAAPTKWVCAYVLTDEAYAVSVTEFRKTSRRERSRTWFYGGAAVTLWLTWQAGTVVGAIVGTAIPEGLSLEFAIPLTFIALLFPALTDRYTEITALVAGTVGVITAVLPFNLGLVTAALVGMSVGVVLEVRAGDFPTPEQPSETRTRGEST